MLKTRWKPLLCSTLTAGALFANAAFAMDLNPDMAEAYNAVIFDQDVQQGFHAVVDETTTSSKTGVASKKTVDVTATGFDKGEKDLAVIIKTTAEDAENTYYYADGNFYTDTAEGKVRTAMPMSQIGALVNMNIYLSLASNSLSMLYATPADDGTTEYGFSATDTSLGDYKQILLDALAATSGSTINYLQGTMLADADGHIKERRIDMDYTLQTEAGGSETFHKEAAVTFDQIGADVNVELPDLSAYKEESQTPQVQIQSSSRKVYTTADVNVRSAGSINASIIGSAFAGTALNETGVTSDGWTQVDFNGIAGYISSSFISDTAPAPKAEAVSATKTETKKADTVTANVQNASGTMYTTTGINIRAAASTGASIIGSLAKGDAVTITGTTADGWTRISLGGSAAGFVSTQYLTWTKPEKTVKYGYVKGYITDVGMFLMTISVNYGEYSLTFNRRYASITPSLGDRGLQLGDVVGVSYAADGEAYTAESIEVFLDPEPYYGDESEEDNNGAPGEYYFYSVSGSVNWYDPASQTLCITAYGESWDDYSFYIGDATILTENHEIPGATVTVDYSAPYGERFAGMYATCVY